MDISPAAIPDVRLLRPKRHGDARGFFSETWSRARFAAAGIDLDFVQDNHAFSAAAGTLRGLHFQIGPAAQAKLVHCPQGAIYDVAVDLRRGSPSFGRHVAAVLSAAEWNQILVPAGFAHGYCTLEPDTVVVYKVTAPYAPEAERGVRWDDPALGIEWPVDPAAAILSPRDRNWPLLADLRDFF
jgi:dTDP-4-dehydrorhamnose 3,5-epimerase